MIGDVSTPPERLAALLSAEVDGEDEGVALALNRWVAAIDAKDPRTRALAVEFVRRAETRVEQMHFELQQIVRPSLPIARAIAAGRYDSASVCRERP